MIGRSNVTPVARLTRGLVVAATSTFVAGASHAVAGGVVPVVAAVLALALGTLVCVILAGRRLSLPRVVLGVAVSQIVFHSLFTPFANGSAAQAGGISVGHTHEFVSTIPLTTVAGTDYLGLPMALAHLGAGLLTVLLVCRGETLWWALVGILSATLSAIFAWTASPVTGGLRAMPAGPAAAGFNDLLRYAARQHLRGPPMGRLTAA